MPSSSSVGQAAREALSTARRLPAPPLRGASEVVVAACPGGEAPASTLYLALRHAGVRAVRAGCVEAAVHILPYTEGGEVVVAFTGGGRDSHLMHLANAASALGVALHAYGPPLHPAYADQYAELGGEYQVVGGDHLLALMVAAILWAPKPWGPRASRIGEELEALPGSGEWLESTLPELLHAVARGVEVAAYTPSTEAGAMYLLARGAAQSVAPLHLAPTMRGRRVLAVYTSVEEHAYRQAILAAKLRGADVAEARLNTEPLTASIYIALAAHARPP
ncbi:MAG: hypothetical protein LRS49_04645 [Desulfurococcales archaeon]|nr:hypothetical protein [Desulfurococcales archaeon]